MGHKQIEVRQAIPAPPAVMFAVLLDRSEWPAWSGHTGFEPVRPGVAGPYDIGSVGLLRSGRRRVMREEIVESSVTAGSATRCWPACRCGTTGPTST